MKLSKVITALLSVTFVLFNSMTECHVKAATDDKIIDIWMDNFDIWKNLPTRLSNGAQVGFLDLDFDGILELVTAYSDRSGSELEFYRIEDAVVTKLNTSMTYIPFDVKLYYSSETDSIEYYGTDANSGGYNTYEDTFGSFAFKSSQNMVVRTDYFANAAINGVAKYYDCRSGKAIEITETEYNTCKENFMATLTDLHLNYKFVDIRKLSDEEIKNKLLESYNTFSYDEISDALTTDSEEPLLKMGDADNDGKQTVSDVILFQKWLLAKSSVKLNNWEAVDFNKDGILDVFDLGLMKRQLIQA